MLGTPVQYCRFRILPFYNSNGNSKNTKSISCNLSFVIVNLLLCQDHHAPSITTYPVQHGEDWDSNATQATSTQKSHKLGKL